MSHELENYVKRIVDQTDCSKTERDDLYEEMLIHVYMICDEQLEQGKSKEEATEYAMKSFGKEAEIGDRLQQAMFPFRKELLLLLAILGFLFTIGEYLIVLIEEKVALFHVLSGIIGHSLVLFFALNRSYSINRKIWLSLALLLNFLLLVGNATGTPAPLGNNIFWMIGFLLMVLLNVFLLYRTALTYETNSHNKRARRVIHAVNITLGLLTALPGLYLLLIAIGFGAPASVLFYVIVPLLVWVLLYTAQVMLARRHPKGALVSLLLSAGVLGFIFMPWLAAFFGFEIGF
ncbi:permease prefix domain 1-containing protein [Bacillus piscicola]|uniref:permease prefix domain 1-containing protein n=1 Tax=Bacillus piscicola TaxID=1632684 RepID=UPI001F0916DB|nr:permease prefix domain 1-containing protein [Bacillus piscicola]